MREKGERQTKYWPSGSRHTPPIPDPGASVVPIQVGVKGSNSRRWVGLLPRLQINSRQSSSSSCTSVVSWTCLPSTLLRACCTRVNMPLDPYMTGVVLCSSPRRLRHMHPLHHLHHFLREVVRAFLWMASNAASTFSCRLGGRHSRWAIVSSSHPRNFF